MCGIFTTFPEVYVHLQDGDAVYTEMRYSQAKTCRYRTEYGVPCREDGAQHQAREGLLEGGDESGLSCGGIHGRRGVGFETAEAVV